MVKELSEEVWNRYKLLIPKVRELYHPALPSSLRYNGRIEADVDYVPPEDILNCLRHWLEERHESSVFYFLTESVEGQKTDFEILTDELTVEVLSAINICNENVFVGKNFDWAVFIDHEGCMHVAGSQELFDRLQAPNSSEGFEL